MRYLHVMLANEGCTYRFINALYNNLPEEEFNEHSFLITDNINSVIRNCPTLLKFSNCIYYPPQPNPKKAQKNIAAFALALFEQAGVVVWHSITQMNNWRLAKAAARKDIVEKSAWVTMMNDRLKPSLKNKKGDEKKLAKYKIDFMCAVPYVNFTASWGRDNFIKDFGKKCIASFPYPVLQEYLDEMDKHEPRDVDGALNVWVGYNGRSFNCHENLVGCLSHLIGQDVRFIFPMNFALRGDWGVTQDFKYRAKVTDNTVLKFGKGSATRLRRRNVPVKDYFNTLALADIGIFWDNKPISYDVIYFLLYMRKKVFVRATSFYATKLGLLGLPVQTLSAMGKMTLEELAAPAEWDGAHDWLFNAIAEKPATDRWIRWLDAIYGKRNVGYSYDIVTTDKPKNIKPKRPMFDDVDFAIGIGCHNGAEIFDSIDFDLGAELFDDIDFDFFEDDAESYEDEPIDEAFDDSDDLIEDGSVESLEFFNDAVSAQNDNISQEENDS